MSELTNKSIIVTGGGSGIGRAAVDLLVEAGATVTIADFDAVTGAAVAQSMAGRSPARVQFVCTDVSDESSVRNMVEQAVSFGHGRLDGAINAAGVPQAGRKLHELEAVQWDSHFAVNLRGVFLCMKYQIEAMLRNDGGSIVVISSIAAVLGLVTSPEYCASKAGVNGLVRSAAIDYAKQGIRVNALLPGATRTPLAMKALATKPAGVGPMPVPNGRMAEPVEIARGAVWMVSDASSYMSGSCMTIDAGLSIA